MITQQSLQYDSIQGTLAHISRLLSDLIKKLEEVEQPEPTIPPKPTKRYEIGEWRADAILALMPTGKWMTLQEISATIGESHSSCAFSLQLLIGRGSIKREGRRYLKIKEDQ